MLSCINSIFRRSNGERGLLGSTIASADELMKAQNISFIKLTKREREFSFDSAFALYSEIACSCTGCYLENMIYQIIFISFDRHRKVLSSFDFLGRNCGWLFCFNQTSEIKFLATKKTNILQIIIITIINVFYKYGFSPKSAHVPSHCQDYAPLRGDINSISNLQAAY